MQDERMQTQVAEVPPGAVPEDPTEEVSQAELEAQQVLELPDREAISVVNAALALPAGTAASAGLLTSE